MWLIPAIIFSACLVLFISWVYEKGSQKQEKDNGINKKYRIAWLLFIAYIIVTFQTVFFSREAGSRKEISLVLFETWGHSFHMHAMFIENIIMFIPFGVLLPIVFKPSQKRLEMCADWFFMFLWYRDHTAYYAERIFTIG